MDVMKKIDIFGDSIMRGILLNSKDQRYYPMPADGIKSFEEEFSVSINNKAKFGCTIQKGSRQMEAALEKGLHCDSVLLEYGGNDCDFKWNEVSADPQGEHSPLTPLPLFESLYRQMIARLQALKITPIIMSLPPINSEKYLNWIVRDGLSSENILHWLGDVNMIYRFQELYSAAAAKIAYETRCIYVDVRSQFLDKHHYTDFLCDDGIHPNEMGHQLIYRAFHLAAEQLQNAFPHTNGIPRLLTD